MSDVKISQFPYVGNTGYTPNDLFVFVNYLNPTGTTSNTKIDDFKNFTIIDSYNYFLPLSGGSVTGSTTFTNGLTANTISATTIYVSPGGANGIVQTITGLNTNNTNPENPVINISVDGVSITGDGTPTNPLVSSNPNINLPSCKININSNTGLSNTNNGVLFLSLFNNTVYNTSPSNFVITNSKIQIVNSGRYLILGRYSSYDMLDGTDFLSVGVLSAATSGNLDLGTTIENLDKGYIGTTINGEASKSGSMLYVASGGEWIGLNALHGGASGGSGTQGYPVFNNLLFNQPYLEIIKIS